MHIKVKSIIITLLFLFVVYTPAHATVYFYFDAENGTVGNYVPNPPLCQTECSGGGERATYQSSGGAPQGAKYFQWQTVDNQTNAYTEIHPSPGFPITNVLGKTYYLAYFFNFTRINSNDIWHETGQSGDKGVELVGSGLRWAVGGGHWPSHADNQDHRYTMMGGNATYHLNPELEVQDGYVQNQSGYNGNNPLQLQYEHWYSAVMAVKMATDNTGSFTVYIDGIKLYEYNNIKTVATTSATITDIWMGGTIAQGAYDAPAHHRKFDALMLTDNWQDIVDGGYLSGGGGDTPPPSDGGDTASSGGDASGGSGCGFVKDDGKGQKAKGEGRAFAIMLIIALAGIAIARRFFNRFSYNL